MSENKYTPEVTRRGYSGGMAVGCNLITYRPLLDTEATVTHSGRTAALMSITAGRKDDAKKKYPYQSGYVDIFAEADPSGRNKYLMWAMKELVENQRPTDDIIEVMRAFDQNQNRLEERDINKWDFDTLADELKLLQQFEGDAQRARSIQNGAQVVKRYPDGARLVKVNNHDAAEFYGKNTKWCVSNPSGKYWKEYTDKGSEFWFYLPRGDQGQRLAIQRARAEHHYTPPGIHVWNTGDTRVVTLPWNRSRPEQFVHGEAYEKITRELLPQIMEDAEIEPVTGDEPSGDPPDEYLELPDGMRFRIDPGETQGYLQAYWAVEGTEHDTLTHYREAKTVGGQRLDREELGTIKVTNVTVLGDPQSGELIVVPPDEVEARGQELADETKDVIQAFKQPAMVNEAGDTVWRSVNKEMDREFLPSGYSATYVVSSTSNAYPSLEAAKEAAQEQADKTLNPVNVYREVHQPNGELYTSDSVDVARPRYEMQYRVFPSGVGAGLLQGAGKIALRLLARTGETQEIWSVAMPRSEWAGELEPQKRIHLSTVDPERLKVLWRLLPEGADEHLTREYSRPFTSEEEAVAAAEEAPGRYSLAAEYSHPEVQGIHREFGREIGESNLVHAYAVTADGDDNADQVYYMTPDREHALRWAEHYAAAQHESVDVIKGYYRRHEPPPEGRFFYEEHVETFDGRYTIFAVIRHGRSDYKNNAEALFESYGAAEETAQEMANEHNEPFDVDEIEVSGSDWTLVRSQVVEPDSPAWQMIFTVIPGGVTDPADFVEQHTTRWRAVPAAQRLANETGITHFVDQVRYADIDGNDVYEHMERLDTLEPEQRYAAVNVVDEDPESHDDLFWDVDQPGQLNTQDTAFPTVTDNNDPDGADPWAHRRKREGGALDNRRFVTVTYDHVSAASTGFTPTRTGRPVAVRRDVSAAAHDVPRDCGDGRGSAGTDDGGYVTVSARDLSTGGRSRAGVHVSVDGVSDSGRDVRGAVRADSDRLSDSADARRADPDRRVGAVPGRITQPGRLSGSKSAVERAFRELGGRATDASDHDQWFLPGADKHVGLNHGQSKFEGRELAGYLRASGYPELLVLWAMGKRLQPGERAALEAYDWTKYGGPAPATAPEAALTSDQLYDLARTLYNRPLEEGDLDALEQDEWWTAYPEYKSLPEEQRDKLDKAIEDVKRIGSVTVTAADIRQATPYGWELGDLTEEEADAHADTKIDTYTMWNESYSSENQYEDPNLKLGMSNSDAWVDPAGTWHPLHTKQTSTHAVWAWRYFDTPDMRPAAALKKLKDDGWVRVQRPDAIQANQFNSLTKRVAQELADQTNRSVWVETREGLYQYDYHTGKFVNKSREVIAKVFHTSKAPFETGKIRPVKFARSAFVLVAGRIDDLVAEFPSVDEQLLRSVKPGHVDWVRRQLNAGEDPEAIVEAVQTFDRVKQRLEQKDLNQYADPASVIEAAARLPQTRRERREEGAEHIADLSGPYKLIKVTTFEASCLYGSNTRWCTTGEDRTHWDEYAQHGVNMYYIVGGPEKYAIAEIQGTAQAFDATNHDIPLTSAPEPVKEALDMLTPGWRENTVIKWLVGGWTADGDVQAHYVDTEEQADAWIERMSDDLVGGTKYFMSVTTERQFPPPERAIQYMLDNQQVMGEQFGRMARVASPKRLEYLKKTFPRASRVLDYLARHDPSGEQYKHLNEMWDLVRGGADPWRVTDNFETWLNRKQIKKITGLDDAQLKAELFSDGSSEIAHRYEHLSDVKRIIDEYVQDQGQATSLFHTYRNGIADTHEDQYSQRIRSLTALLENHTEFEDSALKQAVAAVARGRNPGDVLHTVSKHKNNAEYTQVAPGIIEYENYSAAVSMRGYDTEWCWAYTSTDEYWNSYHANNRLFSVEVDGELYGVAVDRETGAISEIEDARDLPPPDGVPAVIEQRMQEAGLLSSDHASKQPERSPEETALLNHGVEPEKAAFYAKVVSVRDAEEWADFIRTADERFPHVTRTFIDASMSLFQDKPIHPDQLSDDLKQVMEPLLARNISHPRSLYDLITRNPEAAMRLGPRLQDLTVSEIFTRLRSRDLPPKAQQIIETYAPDNVPDRGFKQLYEKFGDAGLKLLEKYMKLNMYRLHHFQLEKLIDQASTFEEFEQALQGEVDDAMVPDWSHRHQAQLEAEPTVAVDLDGTLLMASARTATLHGFHGSDADDIEQLEHRTPSYEGGLGGGVYVGDYAASRGFEAVYFERGSGEELLVFDPSRVQINRTADARTAKVYHGSFELFSTSDPERGQLGFHVGTLGQAINRLRDTAYTDRDTGEELEGADPPEEAYVYQYDIDPKKLYRMDDLRTWRGDQLVGLFRNLLPPPSGLQRAYLEEAAQEWEQYDADLAAYQDEMEEFRRGVSDVDWAPEPPDKPDDSAVYAWVREGLKELGYDGIVYRNLYEKDFGPSTLDSYILFDHVTPTKTVELDTGTFDTPEELQGLPRENHDPAIEEPLEEQQEFDSTYREVQARVMHPPSKQEGNRVFYHGTSASKVPSIVSQGLRAGSGTEFAPAVAGDAQLHGEPAVYLTDWRDAAMRYGIGLDREQDTAIIEVTLPDAAAAQLAVDKMDDPQRAKWYPGMFMPQQPFFDESVQPHQYIYPGDIPPEWITAVYMHSPTAEQLTPPGFVPESIEAIQWAQEVARKLNDVQDVDEAAQVLNNNYKEMQELGVDVNDWEFAKYDSEGWGSEAQFMERFIDPIVEQLEEAASYPGYVALDAHTEGMERMDPAAAVVRAVEWFGAPRTAAVNVVDEAPESHDEPTVAVDLDGTLLMDIDYDAPPEPSGQPALSPPQDGAAGAMASFDELGWRVLIFTARFSKATSQAQAEHMREEIDDHLRDHGIHFDEIVLGPKPVADVYIDDKAQPFTGDWWSLVKDVTTRKEAAPHYRYKYWVAPDGTWFPVRESHGEWIDAHGGEHGVEDFDDALLSGWIRVSGGGVHIASVDHVDAGLLRQTLQAMSDQFEEGEYIHIETEIGRGGAVRVLRPGKVVRAGMSEDDAWVDPEGTWHKLGDMITHKSWAQRYTGQRDGGMQQLFNAGWVRVAVPDSVEAKHVTPLVKQVAKMLAADHGRQVFIDTDDGVHVYDPDTNRLRKDAQSGIHAWVSPDGRWNELTGASQHRYWLEDAGLSFKEAADKGYISVHGDGVAGNYTDRARVISIAKELYEKTGLPAIHIAYADAPPGEYNKILLDGNRVTSLEAYRKLASTQQSSADTIEVSS